MTESNSARFLGSGFVHKKFDEFVEHPGADVQLVERYRQLMIELRSTSPVPKPIEDMLKAISDPGAEFVITHNDDGTFSCRVDTPTASPEPCP